jgi:hypothetical protein
VASPIDTPWLSLNYSFVPKRGRTLSPAAAAFLEIVREIESEIPGWGRSEQPEQFPRAV